MTADRSLTVIVPGSLETRTGGYEYDRRMIAGLRDRGWSITVRTIDDAGFPWPAGRARSEARSILASIEAGALVLIDGLAMGVLPSEVAHERDRLRIVALVHHPLAHETGLSADAALQLEASERRALASARRVIVTSRATVQALIPYGVPSADIIVVEPGTDPAPIAHGSGGPSIQFLAVGSIVPRKGFETLVDAFATLADRPWRLVCAGSLARAPATVARVRARVAEAGLSGRVEFTGELAEAALAAVYDRADCFVLPTFYEGYGMVVAEALARGLPVISTPTGGIADLVGLEAGILVPVADAGALADALAHVIDAPASLDRWRAGARAVRDRLPTWSDRAEEMALALSAI
jgi:glycosyltransferase involved in cell wall biosynthesis